MTISNLAPVTEAEILAVRSVFERLAAGAPIATNSQATTWRDDLEANSPDVREVAVVARSLRISTDTLKRWCLKDPSLGGKIGSRWHASISRARAYRDRRAA